MVPLSGGLDSRAILAGLLEHISPASIHTYTFGTPGTYDFDIGNLVAASAGTRHCAFDLSQYSYTLDNLLDISRRVDGRTVLFQHAPVSMLHGEYGKSPVVFWVGFMGDPLSGSHLLSSESETWEQAKARFVVRNRFAQSNDLTRSGFKPEEQLPLTPPLDSQDLCYDDQIDFGVRQECYVKPLVLLSGYEYCTPFLHAEWTNFILGVPRRYRERQFLYKEVLKTAYPKLFSLPTKNTYGLPLTASRWRQCLHRESLRARAIAKRSILWAKRSISPGSNYIDFDRGLRERWDLKAVVYENIQDLRKRRIIDWIDVDAIWNRHQRGQGNHADGLTLLASLEINLKTGQSGE